jgi:hypothetical protein
MSHALPDHEAVLRRILHAAAEQIEPSADGLERIQARLTHPRPVPVAWICAIGTGLSLRIPPGLRPAIDRILREIRVATEHFMPAPENRPQGGGSPPRLRWLRPVAAMGTAVAIVAAVVYVSIDVTQVMSTAGSDASAQHTGPPGATGGGSGGAPQSYSGGSGPVPSAGASGSLFNRPSACATPGPVKSTFLAPPASASPTLPATPTPTATATPTPTATATPTPSGTVTSSPGNPGSGGSSPSTGADVTANPQAGTSQPSSTAPATSGVAVTTVRHAKAATPAASPCPSPKPHKSKKTSSRTVSPDAGSAAGLMVAPELTGMRSPAEVRGRLS